MTAASSRVIDTGKRSLPAMVPSARPGYRLLDLALGTDADHLQELADAEIEGFFVHGYLRRKRRAAATQTA
ncbi:hypothetical protein AU476_30900 [Cupriavidus sp. UYMSc13B]|nr:hypothetical protein AU476_30900 [Cupriavidus sp. UYMSc13B]